MRKIFFVLCSIVFACSPNNDDDTENTIEIEVSTITVEGATIDWTPPSILESAASVVYKVLLFGDVVADNLTIRTFTFTGLSENVLYTGSVFSLDSNGNETFSEFSFTTLQNPFFDGTLTIATQEEVDNFYYTRVKELVVDGVGITNLEGLQTLQIVEQYITIKNTAIQNLDGLQNVSADLSVLSPGNLIGLPSLKIEFNSQLENISSISGFSIDARHVSLESNTSLSTLNGLVLGEEFKSIGLTDLPLSDLSYFNSFNQIFGLRLKELSLITNLDDLNNLDTLRFLTIDNCQNLSNLNGLSNVNIMRNIQILNCDQITNLNGLELLTSLELIWIESCENMISLEGLDNLFEPVQNAQLILRNNTVLADFCALKTWSQNVTFIVTVGPLFDIIGNAYNPTLNQVQSDTECSQ
ncbi:fibronectin type III domain-containing protein [Psychroserpens burtonensis]|uniref:Fibronectin type III domain-containing protein n=1 Tax=Psychroserpens burtonensis TaxID=49278 RepID=A0A5C7BHG1_9FLAO|nr:fibronectin type III domain-containing protein [Psychroserpens burtonensis]TXE19093.1 fibronectin type III domain-containing protein [Psychroserpens burtonensis]